MHVVVGLSGGVDSAVTALLLREAGHDVSGVFMVNWTADEAGYCNAAEDFASARAVAEELDIPLQRVDFSATYHEQVFQEFLAQYARGRTPNPDILCNRAIKFAPFLAHAQRLGADAVATGHYARLQQDADGPRLLRAIDDNKDQSYFLAGVARGAFERVYFPLGGLTKTEVRAKARAAGLPNHQRKDSTGICFIGERHMRDFLSQWLPAQPGPIVDRHGRELGRHQGVAFYTQGQRRGLAIGGIAGAAEAPWYVIERDVERNRLVVDQDPEHPRLMARSIALIDTHWIRQPAAIDGGHRALELAVRIRHGQALQAATLELGAEGRSSLRFAEPQRAAAPGQYAVFYQGEECLGCAEIDQVHSLEGTVTP
ncbi:MAG: tRNA 2-thiouridine(34) synthase MnmA [Algiphilus sp.]|uniref:tRNA 2-thiouridine(34) synthase MnmA n=1 Tax=Algiphilus sp. TaxID=1872431 RepID=UPI001CA6D2F3|nr:tRNA 2-thiouridine(34) synthase MnmA [Algiphilus sp.]MBY8965285.1 tRNA 2-thiouridine(34) synthase MnmA [Algiphilus acroporae]MCI5063441.1 tRNA 2-thiouridine(34) synthase MnmA [Algiphilus sp.]MCI5103318.1 tRNA 2-thiouridine(34) synthase MnmA [Algiphilus sp.]